METVIVGVAALVLLFGAKWIAERRARKAEEGTVYMVRPKKEN